MKLEKGDVFYAEGPLLCRVKKVRNGVAVCWVINGHWTIGFDAESGVSVAEETDSPALPQCVGLKAILKGPFPGNGYNEQIAAAEEQLTRAAA